MSGLNRSGVSADVACNRATMPINLLLAALQPEFLATGARLQDEMERLDRNFFQMLASIFVLVVPAFVFLALISADPVHLLYGLKWHEAGSVLGIFFLSMPAYVLWALSTPVRWNNGRKYHESALQRPIVVAGALGFCLFGNAGRYAEPFTPSIPLRQDT